MLYERIEQNKRNTVIEALVFLIIYSIVGLSFGYLMFNGTIKGAISGLIVADVLTVLYIWAVCFAFNPVNTIMRLNHAQEISEENDPELFHIIQDMAMVAKIPMPRVFIVDDKSPNAFATGLSPQNSAVCVTRGLREMMNREELEGVLGHEISHISNYDTRVSMFVSLMIAIVGLLADIIYRIGINSNNNDSNAIIAIGAYIFVLIAKFFANLMQLKISREREYLADASSVYLTRNPKGLISALEKIEKGPNMTKASAVTSSMYIEEPMHKHKISDLFSTHPATKKRIMRLEKM